MSSSTFENQYNSTDQKLKKRKFTWYRKMDKIQDQFKIKTPNELGIEGRGLLQLDKEYLQKSDC